VSDIDTAVVDSLKALDPKRPIREADIERSLGEPFEPLRYCEWGIESPANSGGASLGSRARRLLIQIN
jgi:predicted nucleotidyltransferase